MSLSALSYGISAAFTTSPFEAFNLYEAEHDLPQNFLRAINARNGDNNAWAQLERSEITPDEFSQKFMKSPDMMCSLCWRAMPSQRSKNAV